MSRPRKTVDPKRVIYLASSGHTILEFLRHRGVDPFRYAFDLLWPNGEDLRGMICMG